MNDNLPEGGLRHPDTPEASPLTDEEAAWVHGPWVVHPASTPERTVLVPPHVVEWYLRRRESIANAPLPSRRDVDNPAHLAAIANLELSLATPARAAKNSDGRSAARKALAKKLISIFSKGTYRNPYASDRPNRVEDIVRAIARHPEWSRLMESIVRGDSTRRPELLQLMKTGDVLAPLCHSYYLYLDHLAEYPDEEEMRRLTRDD